MRTSLTVGTWACLRQLRGYALLPSRHSSYSSMDINNRKNLNVFLLGLAFMLVFTAFQTMSNVQTTILKSAQDPDSTGYVKGFHGSGYTSLAIIYTVFATANWLAPSVLSVLGPRITMFVGSLCYAGFIAQLLYPNDFLLYGCSALVGLGAAIIWTAQGNFLTVNSDPETMSRNSGVFWAMLQTSLFIGNTFVFFQFQGLDDIDTQTRTTVVAVLLALCLAGNVVFLALRPTPWVLDSNANSNDNGPSQPDTPLNALKSAWKLFLTSDMILLSVTFFYAGLELTFWSGVYGSSIGFTMDFGKETAKSLVGLHGILIGVGEISGGMLFGIFGRLTTRYGRDPVVILGLLLHLLAFFLIFLNLPNDAPFGDTAQHAFIRSSPVIALACSFLLGFGDACYNTQIISILGGVFTRQSAAAFALFKFVQSAAAAAAFFYSNQIVLRYQLAILAVFGVVGTLTFVRVEFLAKRRRLAAEVAERNGRRESEAAYAHLPPEEL